VTAAGKRFRAAMSKLVMDEPFFGVLALRLRIVEDDTCPTAWTNGVSLGYSPSFVLGLAFKALIGLVIHEILHCAMGHPWRRGGRCPLRWNVACDYAINYEILRAGYELPEGALYAQEWDGKSAEWIYDRLPVEAPPEDGPGGQGDDGDDAQDDDDQAQGDQGQDGAQDDDDGPSGDSLPGGQEAQPGEVRDAPTGDDLEDQDATQEGWHQAVTQAASLTEARGEMSEGMRRTVGRILEPVIDWRAVLSEFVDRATNESYTWAAPRQSMAPLGVYLPSRQVSGVGPLVLVIDTSGSVDRTLLGQYEAEVRAIVDEADPTSTTIIYADDSLRGVPVVFERGEEVTLEHRGGCGTDYRPAFRWVEEEAEEEPVALIYLTDLECHFYPEEAPDFPVLWACTGPHPGRYYLDSVEFGDVVLVGA
jgi:predicted metal-dependent peptidase